MGQVSAKLRSVSGGCLAYYCQGCDEIHMVRVEGPAAWGYNGNAEAPTFTPSVLVTWNGVVDGQPVKRICHTFITDGRVQFLGDCTHAFAGRTVDLPDLPDAYSDANYNWGDGG